MMPKVQLKTASMLRALHEPVPHLLKRLGLAPAELVNDSRKALPGKVFVAYPGESRDGRDYIAQAVAQRVDGVLWEADHYQWDPVLTTPNAAGWGARLFGRRWIHWHAPYHLQFFTRDSLQRIAAASGFNVEQTITVTNSSWLAFQWCHLASYPAAGARSVFWNRKEQRSTLQRLAFICLGVADRLGVNAVITRLMDAFGRGDNMTIVLRKRRPG